MAKIFRFAFQAAFLSFLFSSSKLFAATTTWDGDTNSSMNNAANWVGDTKPISGNNDAVVFDSVSGTTFTPDQDIANPLSVLSISISGASIYTLSGSAITSSTITTGSSNNFSVKFEIFFS